MLDDELISLCRTFLPWEGLSTMSDIFCKRRIGLGTLRYILISVAVISILLYAYTAHLPSGSWVSQVSVDKHGALGNWTVNDPVDYQPNNIIITTSVENISSSDKPVTGTLTDREADSESLDRGPDVCVGSNKRLREVEDLLCRVSQPSKHLGK